MCIFWGRAAAATAEPKRPKPKLDEISRSTLSTLCWASLLLLCVRIVTFIDPDFFLSFLHFFFFFRGDFHTISFQWCFFSVYFVCSEFRYFFFRMRHWLSFLFFFRARSAPFTEEPEQQRRTLPKWTVLPQRRESEREEKRVIRSCRVELFRREFSRVSLSCLIAHISDGAATASSEPFKFFVSLLHEKERKVVFFVEVLSEWRRPDLYFIFSWNKRKEKVWLNFERERERFGSRNEW